MTIAHKLNLQLTPASTSVEALGIACVAHIKALGQAFLSNDIASKRSINNLHAVLNFSRSINKQSVPGAEVKHAGLKYIEKNSGQISIRWGCWEKKLFRRIYPDVVVFEADVDCHGNS